MERNKKFSLIPILIPRNICRFILIFPSHHHHDLFDTLHIYTYSFKLILIRDIDESKKYKIQVKSTGNLIEAKKSHNLSKVEKQYSGVKLEVQCSFYVFTEL